MYLVVSRWEVIPGKESEFEERGRIMRDILRATPGVRLTEGFLNEDGHAVAILGYESEEAYNRIVNSEDGVFARAAAENRLDECGRWISSDRGVAVDA